MFTIFCVPLKSIYAFCFFFVCKNILLVAALRKANKTFIPCCITYLLLAARHYGKILDPKYIVLNIKFIPCLPFAKSYYYY